MMQQVLEEQDAWGYLDAAPKTLSAAECKTSYAIDGDYFTKPSAKEVIEAAYSMMSEARPREFPPL